MEVTYDQFLSDLYADRPRSRKTSDHHENIPHIRWGQKLMNLLATVWPEKYREITGSKLDCFYDDTRVDALLSHLSENWGKKIERPFGLTVRHIMDRGLWDRVCEQKGINPWAVNEGLMSSDEMILFSPIEWEAAGLLFGG